MSELPKGWVETSISEITSYVQRGKGPKYSDVLNSFPVINQKAIRWFGIQEEHLKYVNPDTWGSYTEERFIKPGDILWNSTGTGTIGRACLLNEIEAAKAKVVDSHVTILRVNDAAEPRYLFYWIRSPKIQFDIESLSTGTTNQVELSKTKVLETKIPLAPLNEQKRIADKLDSILAKVDRAQARLDKIPAILKRFRQSVLAAATSGELTREWRGDASGKKTIYSTWEIVNLPEAWEVKLLPEVATTRLGKMLDKNKNEGIATKYIGNINVRWNSFDLEDLKEILVSEREISELSILDGDLILCEGGVPGRGAVWRGGKNNLVFQKALHRIRFIDTVLPEFGLYCVEDDFNSNKLATLYTGTTIKHLTGQALNTYPLRIPPLEEQREIVSKVEVLLAKAAQAESLFIKSKVMLDRLTQSILAKAFRGELVTQDQNDEPASELLKRIKSLKIETKLKKKVTPKLKVSSTATIKIAKEAIFDEFEQLKSVLTTDLDAEKHDVLDSLRMSYQVEIQKAQELLVDAKFSVEQFRSITDFKGGYEELKALIMNLLKGIPSVSEPLLAIESWDEKSGDYLMHLVKKK